ncbi:barstar family protein [Streptomyces sp. NPDC004546]|uniref:barstar family protein n=1 Tax=unclassified Streptomyces TaxID=2593676 RepID=UPI0033ADE892
MAGLGRERSPFCAGLVQVRAERVVPESGRPPQRRPGHVGPPRGAPQRCNHVLGFPAFHGMNWDAFWDAITG